MKAITQEWVDKAEADFATASRELGVQSQHEPLWAAFRQTLIDLSSYAVSYRCPGNSATHAMAKIAVADATVVRRAMRLSLGLSIT